MTNVPMKSRRRKGPNEGTGQPIPQRSPQWTPPVQQTSEQTPSHTPNKNQEKIQAEDNSTQEASVQSGANQQVVHAPEAQRPKRTVREPAYLRTTCTKDSEYLLETGLDVLIKEH